MRRLRMRELHDAASKGDLAAVHEALDLGAKVNEWGDCCGTPLHEASTWGRFEVAKALLARGADVHARDMFGNTPLLATGHDATMVLLLDHGSDPLAVNKEGKTVLMRAAHHGGRELLVRLLEAGCDVNARISRNTPLYAATYGSLDTMQFLLERGADPNLATLESGTPLDNVAQWQQRDKVDLLLSYGARHTLCTLAYLGDTEAIRDRLTAGAHVGARNFWKSTPLHCAATNGHLEVAELLLEHGAELDPRDESEFTPLLDAINRHQCAMVEFLIKRGADVSAHDDDGEGTLHWGWERGERRILRMLLDAGATTWDDHLVKCVKNWLATEEG